MKFILQLINLKKPVADALTAKNKHGIAGQFFFGFGDDFVDGNDDRAIFEVGLEFKGPGYALIIEMGDHLQGLHHNLHEKHSLLFRAKAGWSWPDTPLQR